MPEIGDTRVIRQHTEELERHGPRQIERRQWSDVAIRIGNEYFAAVGGRTKPIQHIAIKEDYPLPVWQNPLRAEDFFGVIAPIGDETMEMMRVVQIEFTPFNSETCRWEFQG